MDFELLHIASNLNVSVSTVCRTIALFLRTGSVLPQKRSYRKFLFY